MNIQSRFTRSLALFGFVCSSALAQTYYTDNLTSINTSYWYYNSGTATPNGYTDGATAGGSLISKIAVPDGSSIMR